MSDSDQFEDEFTSVRQPSQLALDAQSLMIHAIDAQGKVNSNQIHQFAILACNRFNKIRHCAYCHKYLKRDEVKKCGTCHRRAYCGQECQALDWTSKRTPKDGGTVGLGQGHRNWCGLALLEEDVEWDVAPKAPMAPNIFKSGRLVARTHIPPLTRILVDGRHEDDPESRSRLLSHSCVANAIQTIDHGHKVRIIVSKREIQPGEEICLNYLTLESEPIWVMSQATPRVILSAKRLQQDSTSTLNEDSLNENSLNEDSLKEDYNTEARRILQTKWGVDCRSHCRCQERSYDNYVDLWKASFFEDSNENCMNAKTRDECLARHYQDMINIELSVRASLELPTGNPVLKAILLGKVFEIASRSKSTLDKGLEAIKEAAQIWKAVVHPKSGVIKQVDAYLQDPTSVKGYLCIDQKWED